MGEASWLTAEPVSWLSQWMYGRKLDMAAPRLQSLLLRLWLQMTSPPQDGSARIKGNLSSLLYNIEKWRHLVHFYLCHVFKTGNWWTSKKSSQAGKKCFNNWKKKAELNESRGKVKAAVWFYLREGYLGQIRHEMRKGALNKLKFSYLVTLLSRTSISHDCRAQEEPCLAGSFLSANTDSV